MDKIARLNELRERLAALRPTKEAAVLRLERRLKTLKPTKSVPLSKEISTGIAKDPQVKKILSALKLAEKAMDSKIQEIERHFEGEIEQMKIGPDLSPTLGKIDKLEVAFEEARRPLIAQYSLLQSEVDYLRQELDRLPKDDPQDAIDALEKRMQTRLANLGGGNQNRDIRLNGSSLLTSFTDINIIPGSNMGIAAAINQKTKYTDLTLYSMASASSVASASVAGGNTQIQYNDNGVFGASSTFTWDKNASVFAVGNAGNGSVLSVNAATSIATVLGNVGIGTTTPINQLHLIRSSVSGSSYVNSNGTTQFPDRLFQSAFSPSVGSNSYAAHLIDVVANATLATGNLNALVSAISTPTTSTTQQPAIVAGSFQISHRGTGSVVSLTGANYTVRNLSTGVVPTMTAQNNSAQNTGGGVITTLTGITGTIANTGTSAITTANAFNAVVANTGIAGTIHHYRVSDITNTTSISGVTYGFYCGDITAGTQTGGAFSFYASDPNSLNYFAGNVGIGTLSPGARLQVGLPGSIAGTIKVAGSTAGTVQIQPASIAGDWTMTLPSVAGLAGQYLQTDGNGITQWSGSRQTSIITANTTGGANAGVDYVYVTNTGITFTLPTAIGNNSQYTVKNMVTSSVLVNTSAGQTIDGNPTASIMTQYQAYSFASNGSVWGIV